jgi:hypothetical protein
MLKRWGVFAAILFLFSCAADARFLRGSGPAGNIWTPFPIGAGGFINGADIQCDQGVGSCNGSGTTTKVVKTDTYGAWWYNPSIANCGNANRTGCWQQLVTIQSMPSGQAGVDIVQTNSPGVYDIAIAPANTNRFAMHFNGQVYLTDNRGVAWRNLGLTADYTANPNGGVSYVGKKIAFDPANQDVLCVSSPTLGVSCTSNASASTPTWVTIPTSSIPASTGQQVYAIAFDPHSAVTGGKTQGIYVVSNGIGVFHSSNAGGSWSELNSSGMPTSINYLFVDAAGNVWEVDNAIGNGCGQLNLYNGTWANKLSNSNCLTGVAVNPNVPANVYAINGSGQLFVSTNTAGSFATTTVGASTATDIQWLAAQEILTGNYMDSS